MLKNIFLLLNLSFTPSAWALEFAFLKNKNAKGQDIRLEVAGEGFTHIAMRLKNGKWLHAHPQSGVEITENLEKYGFLHTILENKNIPPLKKRKIRSYLKSPYDPIFSWKSNDAFYCSELLTKIVKRYFSLQISVTPMDFSAPFWRGYEKKHGLKLPQGAPGNSPDDMYRDLLKQGFKKIHPSFKN